MLLLNRICSILDKQPANTVFAQWDGAVYKDEDELVRYDKFFLMIVRKLKGKYIFQKIPACLGKLPNNEAYIHYTDVPLVRVLNGKRKDKCYAADGSFMEDEKTEVAGIWKELEYGQKGWFFSRKYAPDLYYLDIIEGIETEGYVPWKVPTWYITGKDTPEFELFVRKSASVFLNRFRRDNENAWQTFSRVKASLSVDAGTDSYGNARIGYPFSLVYGRGVKAADPISCGFWMKSTVAEMTRELPAMHITLEEDK